MGFNKSKFSNFFVSMLIPMALIMFIGMFFSVKIVGNTYFVALILAIVFFVLNRKYGKFITNHKLAFILFEPQIATKPQAAGINGKEARCFNIQRILVCINFHLSFSRCLLTYCNQVQVIVQRPQYDEFMRFHGK